MWVKRDGRCEEFDPDKLMSGLRIACARDVHLRGAMLERVVERVEYVMRQTGRTEVSSQMIMTPSSRSCRKLDEVAYIRYAIVYMGLKDLESIRAEIDRLRLQRH